MTDLKTIKESEFFGRSGSSEKSETTILLRTCKYVNCKKEFEPNRKDQMFCCRECKQKNRKYKKYWENRKGKLNI